MLSEPAMTRRVVHVTASLSRCGGGIPPVIWSLAQNMQAFGYQNLVAGLIDEGFEEDCRQQTIPVLAGAVQGPRSLGYSPPLRRELEKEIRPPDVLHTHGLWMYPGILAARLGQKLKCRRIVSPHGMLEPWALNHSRWKKRAAAWLFENYNLRTADCLHALCEREAENFRSYGLRNPIAIIPNGVELAGVNTKRDEQPFLRDHPELAGRHLLLFLSRVHPKKGLPDLLNAWAATKAQDKQWSLLIAGPDEVNHTAQLKALVTALGIDQHVHFLGSVYGQKKVEILSAADAFVLPSLSEGFSMAVLEAAAAGLPILLTQECNFPKLAKAGAAIEVPAGPRGITEGFDHLLRLDRAQRVMMGSNGADLVKQSYGWPTIAAEMIRVYDWLAKAGPRPDCVQLG
jgi:glycosyltransferase involved in cell wall biosynthesis